MIIIIIIIITIIIIMSGLLIKSSRLEIGITKLFYKDIDIHNKKINLN